MKNQTRVVFIQEPTHMTVQDPLLSSEETDIFLAILVRQSRSIERHIVRSVLYDLLCILELPRAEAAVARDHERCIAQLVHADFIYETGHGTDKVVYYVTNAGAERAAAVVIPPGIDAYFERPIQWAAGAGIPRLVEVVNAEKLPPTYALPGKLPRHVADELVARFRAYLDPVTQQ